MVSETRRKVISKRLDMVAEWVVVFAFTTLFMYFIKQPESQFIKVFTIISVVFAVFVLVVINSNIKNTLVRYFWKLNRQQGK